MNKCFFTLSVKMRNIDMKYDFDREINRKNTQSAKWGVIQDPDDPANFGK